MLTSSATTMLRSSMGRSAGALQAALFRAAACPYSTSTAGLLSLAPKPIQQSRQPLPTTPVQFRITYAQPTTPRRHASSTARSRTDAETDATAAEAAAAAQVAAHPESATLDWNTFFQLRKTRRRLQQVFSGAGAIGGGTAGFAVLSSGALETVVGKIPLDPFVTMGLMTFSFAALGWLVGPVLGTVVFNLFKRKYKEQMAIKESQFFARIKKHRVDPTSSSMNNPVPDFYGEKISSVAGYRQWLKDQRAYIKKRSTPFL
ncbi:mitochondrial import protein Pam17-domain-containing protein [Cercophora newfieldiana]|uniref:Presequence translocated-associated motor subunit PAM17 n=1 Tax=Cercophora newfieldiana TaxID=92897 RepID=A0AA39YR01_9PEZI|nr:mitochondrial import protein Pam17-domain-containing protein [Cercophora newfieldiana]